MIRFLSGKTYRVPVESGITIKEFARTVQNTSNMKEGCIALMMNGVILDEEKTVDDYCITNSTVITALKTKNREKEDLILREKEVEDYLITLCKKLSEKRTLSVDATQSDSKMKDVMDLATSKCRVGLTMSAEELTPIVASNDDIFKHFIHTPFFQTVIHDTRLVRRIVYNHPLFCKLLELNPGVKQLTDEDDFLTQIIETITSESGDIASNRNRAFAMIENRLGRKLVLSKKQIDIVSQTHSGIKRQHPFQPFHFSEEQKKALISVVHDKPELVVQFVKATPIYRMLIHKNPELIKEIMSPERLQSLFSPDQLSKVIDLNQKIREDLESKRRKTP